MADTQSAPVKGELSQRVKLEIYNIHIQIVTHGHEFGIGMERMTSKHKQLKLASIASTVLESRYPEGAKTLFTLHTQITSG